MLVLNNPAVSSIAGLNVPDNVIHGINLDALMVGVSTEKIVSIVVGVAGTDGVISKIAITTSVVCVWLTSNVGAYVSMSNGPKINSLPASHIFA